MVKFTGRSVNPAPVIANNLGKIFIKSENNLLLPISSLTLAAFPVLLQGGMVCRDLLNSNSPSTWMQKSFR